MILCSIFVEQTKRKTTHKLNDMTIFANLSNGDQVQIKVEGNKAEIFNYIENYEGNDLGNDLICQSFVTNFEETGVVIFAA